MDRGLRGYTARIAPQPHSTTWSAEPYVPASRSIAQHLPFVGPAGAMLWQCLEEAGVDRHDVCTTNAVKHFKHETRGKPRIHKKPETAEIEACHPWLDAELRAAEVRAALVADLRDAYKRSTQG